MFRLPPRALAVPIAVSLIAAGGFVEVAHAQCGASSSCKQCHEVDGRRPPSAENPWHRDHAFADLCANCHGGDPTSADETVSHASLADPLVGHGERCSGCHERAPALAAVYFSAREKKPP